MGEAGQRKSHNKLHLFREQAECVYCGSTDDPTEEHMPPRSIFPQGERPHGWSFRCCKSCNSFSRGADAVAALFILVDPVLTENWKLQKFKGMVAPISKYAPDAFEDLSAAFKRRPTDALIKQNGLLHRGLQQRLNGPGIKRNLDMFSAKMSMAAFRTLVGRRLSNSGSIYTEWFLNAGMTQEIFDSFLSVMPGFTQLKQGKKVSGQHFNLRYNTDGQGVVIFHASLHDNFHVLSFATDSDEISQHVREVFAGMPREARPTANLITSGLDAFQISPGGALSK